MDNKSSVSEEVPGTESDVKGVPSLDTIERWITKDLGVCLTFLRALHEDVELRKQMAIFLQGRMINGVNRPDPNQVPLFNPKFGQ